MWQKLRSSVFCLLVLAIPVQGFAAAGMLFCGPGHHDSHTRTAGALEHYPGMAMVHSHDEDNASSDGHSDHAHQASEGTSQPGKLNIDKLGADKCSVCSACCNAAAALPMAAIALPAMAPHASPLPAESAAFAGFIPGSLERPPRHLLA